MNDDNIKVESVVNYIDPKATIGAHTNIWRFTHIDQHAFIGNNCSIGQGCYVDGHIGTGTRVQNNVSVFLGVKIGKNCFIGPSCVFTNVKNPRTEYPVGKKYAKTIVEDGATIGAGAVILPGITIGKYAMVGAGAVVTHNVGDFRLVVGNPARDVVGGVCRCGVTDPFSRRAPDFLRPEITKCYNCGRVPEELR